MTDEKDGLVRNAATEDGRILGAHLARLCDAAEPKARLLVPTIPPRCASCAFRAGPHIANGSPQTQMDALKCVIELLEFRCHEPGRAHAPCSGWAMMALADAGREPGDCPWPFSEDPER